MFKLFFESLKLHCGSRVSRTALLVFFCRIFNAETFDGQHHSVALKDLLEEPCSVQNAHWHAVLGSRALLFCGALFVLHVLVGYEVDARVAAPSADNLLHVGFELIAPSLFCAEGEGPAFLGSIDVSDVPPARDFVRNRVRLCVYLAVAATGWSRLRQEVRTYLFFRQAAAKQFKLIFLLAAG